MKYDAVLVFENMINEDDRFYGSPAKYDPLGAPEGQSDWKLLDAFTFGKSIRANLDGLSSGYYNKVVDYGKYVIVVVGYHNIITGRSAEKTILIVFKNKGDGIIMSTSNRYRTINGVQQALSYIRATASTLPNLTNNNK